MIDADECLKKICMEKLTELYGTELKQSVYELLFWELEGIRQSNSALIVLCAKELIEKLGLTPYEIAYNGTVGALLVSYLCGITCINPLESKLSMHPEFFIGKNGDALLDINLFIPSNIENEINEIIEKYKKEHQAYFLSTKGDWSVYDIFQTIGERVILHPYGIQFVPQEHNILEKIPSGKCMSGKYEKAIMQKDYSWNFNKIDFFSCKETDFIYSLMKKTGVNVADISLDDKAVIRLFQSNIRREKKSSENLSPLGVPEFQSEYIFEIMETIQPQSFIDIVAVIALSYGNGTWEENAKLLLENNVVTKDRIITTSEDVYDSMLAFGFGKEDAYMITKMVRQGKAKMKKSEQWLIYRQQILKAGAEVWLLWSLEQITYLFSRASAYRYALNSWWCAWFKIYYPKEFYEVYFELCGKESLIHAIREGKDSFDNYLSRQRETIDIQEWDVDIEVAKEMFRREISD